jgi:auxin influx carrier (AUX1 LAX family)
MESSRRPHRFKYVYIFVVLYTWLISYPSAIAPYWAFGETIIRQSNAFGILPKSPWRMTAIVLMVMHQSISFIIFVHPIFLLVEKFARVHHRSMLLRILVRIPVVVLVWFVALAIPFFGPINSVMGAFLLTVVVYMLPLATFMYAYRTKAARQVLLFFILMILFYWVSFCIHQNYIYDHHHQKPFSTLQDHFDTFDESVILSLNS